VEFTTTRGGGFTIANYSRPLCITVPLTLSSLRSTLPPRENEEIDILLRVPRASILRELHLALTALLALRFTQGLDGFCSRRLILSDLILGLRDTF
jgi:hypothetical protein